MDFRIYQIELSSYCNMKCEYCPHPSMERGKGFMSTEVLAACISHCAAAGDSLLVLHHFGEPLLHPELAERLELIAEAGFVAHMSTNALLLERAWPVLIEAPLSLAVTLAVHQWVGDGEAAYERALAEWTNRARGTNVTILRANNALSGQFRFHQWTRGKNTAWNASQCPFIRQNLAVVLWNGDLATCCCDHEGVTVRGNILTTRERESSCWSACQTCDVGRIMKDQVW